MATELCSPRPRSTFYNFGDDSRTSRFGEVGRSVFVNGGVIEEEFRGKINSLEYSSFCLISFITQLGRYGRMLIVARYLLTLALARCQQVFIM